MYIKTLIFCSLFFFSQHCFNCWSKDFSIFINESLHLCHYRSDQREFGENFNGARSDNAKNNLNMAGKNVNHSKGQVNGRKNLHGHAEKYNSNDNKQNTSLAIVLKSFFNCIYSYWRACLKKQYFPLYDSPHKETISERSCYHGELHLSIHNFLLHIEVQNMFQINLTFAHFNLAYSHKGCFYYNYIMVSSGLISILEIDKQNRIRY